MDYRTEDGTANAGSDYEFAEGTLVFKPGERVKGTEGDGLAAALLVTAIRTLTWFHRDYRRRD